MGRNGNVGNHNSGRKSKKEEIAGAIEMIKDEALKELAKSKVHKQLQNIPDGFLRGFDATRELALPIVLKHIAVKAELTGKDGQPLVIEISETIAKKRGLK